MASVQRMRAKAEGTGALKTSEQQKVETKTVGSEQVIVVEQADPERRSISLPMILRLLTDSLRCPIRPILIRAISGGALALGGAVALGAAWGNNWGWGCGWDQGDINVNVNNNYVRNYNKNNNIKAGRPASGSISPNTAATRPTAIVAPPVNMADARRVVPVARESLAAWVGSANPVAQAALVEWGNRVALEA